MADIVPGETSSDPAALRIFLVNPVWDRVLSLNFDNVNHARQGLCGFAVAMKGKTGVDVEAIQHPNRVKPIE